jgi:hypothetical protein
MNFGSNPELFEYLIPRSEAIGSEPGGGVARRSCMRNRAALGTHQATLQWSGAKGEVGDRGLKKLTVAEEVGASYNGGKSRAGSGAAQADGRMERLCTVELLTGEGVTVAEMA